MAPSRKALLDLLYRAGIPRSQADHWFNGCAYAGDDVLWCEDADQVKAIKGMRPDWADGLRKAGIRRLKVGAPPERTGPPPDPPFDPTRAFR